MYFYMLFHAMIPLSYHESNVLQFTNDNVSSARHGRKRGLVSPLHLLANLHCRILDLVALVPT